MANDDTTPTPNRSRRERSTRYPGVPLDDCIEMCKFIESRGLDGLTAPDIASALGYKNIKTNTFSARLSATRQFGLLLLNDDGYGLTPLAKSILHPVDLNDLGRLHRQALREPPIYSDLIERLDGKRVPDLEILGNVLYHHHQIIATAKESAAEAFLTSARFAGALGADMILRVEAQTAITPMIVPSTSASTEVRPTAPAVQRDVARSHSEADPTGIRIDLRLWDDDEGKVIRVRAPQSLTRDSYDRLLQALRLHIRIEGESS